MIRRKRIRWKKILIWGTYLAFLLLAGIPVFTYAYYLPDLDDKDRLMHKNNSGLTLLDRNGEPFFNFYEAKNKDVTQLKNVPEHLQQAVIAVEDKEFYAHSGFSIKGIVRAALANAKSGSIQQGGSTITQELVKNNLLNPKKSYMRKYQEVVLAYAINNRYSKEEILEMYLNSVYFGEGAFGIENAAQTYFGIPANELTLEQSAMLAGLLPAPSAYSPLSNDPDIAEERKKIVLNEMSETGMITQEESEAAADKKITYNPQTENVNVLAPHFALMVRDELIKQYGEEYVIRSGLVVKTTLNSEWQKYAEDTLKQQISRLNRSGATNGSAVAIDPKTGEILIMVGSHNWHDKQNGKINMAISPRQPGSSFKPLIYANAIDTRLITPATILKDEPKTYQRNYKPTNFDNRFRGPVTVRRALANSLNVPSVEVMNMVGVKNGLATASRFGITTLGNDSSQYGLSLVLGAGEVRLTELTNAYAVFANQGVRNEPKSILEIKDKYGKKLKTKNSSKQTVISDETAFLISNILSDNRTRAETFGNRLNIGRTAAVKTGTTQDNRDVLTVGYTPSLAVGVWVGNNDNSPTHGLTGSLGASPIWKALMQDFLSNHPDEPFQQPPTIEKVKVCYIISDGENATPSAMSEYAIRGTVSQQDCKIPEPTKEDKDNDEKDDEENEVGNEKDEKQERKEDNKNENEDDKPEPSATPQPTPTAEPPPTEEDEDQE